MILCDFPPTRVSRALSPNGRVHWAVKRKAKAHVLFKVALMALCADFKPVVGPVRIRLRYIYPVRRKRDIDNASTGVTKAVIDALVQCEILPDDSSAHVVSVDPEIVVEKGRRRLEVILEPAPLIRTALEHGAEGIDRVARR